MVCRSVLFGHKLVGVVVLSNSKTEEQTRKGQRQDEVVMDGSDSDAGMKENNNSINRLKNRRNVNSKSILSPLVLENRDSITEILPYLLIASIGDSILDDAKLLSDSGIKYLISCAKENRMLSKRRKALSAMNLSLTEIQLDDAPDAALTEPIKIVFPIIKRAKKG